MSLNDLHPDDVLAMHLIAVTLQGLRALVQTDPTRSANCEIGPFPDALAEIVRDDLVCTARGEASKLFRRATDAAGIYRRPKPAAQYPVRVTVRPAARPGHSLLTVTLDITHKENDLP